MACGGISLDTDLHVIAKDTLIAVRYRDEILRVIARPDTCAVGPGFLLIQDNAQSYVAWVCRQFLDEEGIDTIDWVMYQCIRHIESHYELSW